MVMTSRERCRRRVSCSASIRSSTGITTSFEIIVLSATVETMIMAVAALSPPMKTTSASQGAAASSGRKSTIRSPSSMPPSRPARAIGMTKMLISRRYVGKAQVAVRMCRSSTFSITATWNCRGSTKITEPASRIIKNQSR